MRLRLVTIVFFLLLGKISLGQVDNYWFFGQAGSVKFTGGAPSFNLTPGASPSFLSIEGAAVVSDNAGNLLFYTNGETVWNKNNVIMQNGTGLNGSVSATQSCPIIKKSNNIYLIFTLPSNLGNIGLCYTEVDMSLNGGLGAVNTTLKNQVVIAGPLTEKMAVVSHCNGIDFWIITHRWNNNTFEKVLVTPSSITVQSPQSIGSTHTGTTFDAAGGYLKFSPDGKRFAVAVNNQSTSLVELFHFDNTNGDISNPEVLPIYGGEYGISFSPDNSKLYVSAAKDTTILGRPRVINRLAQYNMLARNISGSKVLITQQNDTIGLKFGALQNGPNGKIYLVQYGRDNLNVINNPSGWRNACNFDTASVKLLSSTGRFGLPNFNEIIYNKPLEANFTFQPFCVGNPAQFTDSSVTNAKQYWWDFGDATTINDTSTLRDPVYVYNNIGTYNVRLVVFDGCSVYDTIVKPVLVSNKLPVNLGVDTINICAGNTDTLFSNFTGSLNYEWLYSSGPPWNYTQLADTVAYLVPNATGWYKLLVDNGNCDGVDSAFVYINNSPPLSALDSVYLLCLGGNVQLNAGNAGAIYTWSTGQQSQIINTDTVGKYYVLIQDRGCSLYDSTLVISDIVNLLSPIPDTSLCNNVPSFINLTSSDYGPGSSYAWSDGTQGRSITINDTGTYILSITTPRGCALFDTVLVKLRCPTAIYVPTAFTPNNDGPQSNEIFTPLVTSASDYNLQIFDRFGGKVFESNTIGEGWNGRLNNIGDECKSGLYYWLITYYTADLTRYLTEHGQVVLIR